MTNIIEIPPHLAIAAIVFQLVTVWFLMRIAYRFGLGLFNYLSISIYIGLLRRLIEYALTFNAFQSIAPTVRLYSLAYAPLLFSLFFILGLIQIYNRFELLKYKTKGE